MDVYEDNHIAADWVAEQTEARGNVLKPMCSKQKPMTPLLGLRSVWDETDKTQDQWNCLDCFVDTGAAFKLI